MPENFTHIHGSAQLAIQRDHLATAQQARKGSSLSRFCPRFNQDWALTAADCGPLRQPALIEWCVPLHVRERSSACIKLAVHTRPHKCQREGSLRQRTRCVRCSWFNSAPGLEGSHPKTASVVPSSHERGHLSFLPTPLPKHPRSPPLRWVFFERFYSFSRTFYRLSFFIREIHGRLVRR